MYKYLCGVIEKCLESYQTVWAHTTLAKGASTIWAFSAVSLKKKYADRVRLFVDTVSDQPDETFDEDEKAHWRKLFLNADSTQIHSKSSDPLNQSLADMWMIQRSDILIAICDSSQKGISNFLFYAKSQGKLIKLVNPAQFKEIPTKPKGKVYR